MPKLALRRLWRSFFFYLFLFGFSVHAHGFSADIPVSAT